MKLLETPPTSTFKIIHAAENIASFRTINKQTQNDQTNWQASKTTMQYSSSISNTETSNDDHKYRTFRIKILMDELPLNKLSIINIRKSFKPVTIDAINPQKQTCITFPVKIR